jgi:hypothetical protein
MFGKEICDLLATSFAVAGAISNSSFEGDFFKACRSFLHGLKQTDEFDTFTDTAGPESGHHFFIWLHGFFPGATD